MDSFQALQRTTKFRPTGLKNFPPVTPSQWGVLMALEGGNPASVKDVAGMLGVTSSAATQLVDGLVESGYVLRTEDPNDRRKMTLTLSGKTKKQVEKMKEECMSTFLELFEALTDEEFDQLIVLHNKIFERHSKNKH